MIPKSKHWLIAALLCLVIAPGSVFAIQTLTNPESLPGFYARLGNNGSSAKTAGNNTYIKFFEDRWLAIMFVPYPYAQTLDASLIKQVFNRARKKASGAAYLRGKFGLLSDSATLQIERYGYLEDRIIFECGSLAPCTIRMSDGFLELIKPGVINEHIIRYDHVASP
jgi:hypothetical protein